MGTSRTSNKDILDAILGLTAAITQNHSAPAIITEPREGINVPALEQDVPAPDTDEIKVSEEYLANRKVAAQAHANKVSGTVVLYARRNLKGEIKLAFAQQGRFDTLKDNGLLGPVASYNPE